MTHGSLKSLSSFFCIAESQLGTYPGETAAEPIALSAAEGQTDADPRPEQGLEPSDVEGSRTWVQPDPGGGAAV